MRKVRVLFFVYVTVLALAVVGLGASFLFAPPRDPNTFYRPFSGAVRTLDPAEVNDTVGSELLAYVFEALYNYQYTKVPYEVVPELASAMPAVSADGLTMTIPVRHGIHYYDPEHAVWPDGVGPEVTAADFVYSFKRVCDANLASPNYSFVFQDRFVGLDDWWKYTQSHPNGTVDYDRPMPGFQVDPADPYKLVLRFTTPYPQMVYNLVNCPCSPMSRAIAEHWKGEVRKHPVGTGAYAMAENLRDQRITYVANPAYRGRPDVDGLTVVPPDQRLPHIKRVQLDFFSEDMPVWMLFKQGLFDIGTIPKDAYSSAIGGGGDLTPEMVQKGVVLKKYSQPSTSYIGFNLTDPILGKNKPLRQAMSLAFDRQGFITKFANGRGIPAVGPIPPGFPTYDQNRVNPYTQLNLARARELMVEAERINGGPIPPIRILYRDADTLARQMSDFYIDQMAQIGVKLVPEFRDFARWLEMTDARQFQLFDGGWSSDYPDEQDFLQLFYGPNAAPGGLNTVGYVNPDFDKLYDRAKVMQDTPERRALYLQMQHIVEDDCPWLMTSYPLAFGLSYDWVGHRVPMDYGHGYSQFTTLDADLRAKRLGH